MLTDQQKTEQKELSGGSGAKLEIIENYSGKKVLKSISGCTLKASKLLKQYEWLSERQENHHIAHVFGLYHGEDYCHYSMTYYEDYLNLDKYLKTASSSDAARMLSKILDHIDETIHVSLGTIQSTELFSRYLNDKLFEKVIHCAERSSDFQQLLKWPELIINGIHYKNFFHYYERIINDQRILRLNSSFSQCHIHGDLTFENILVDPENHHFVLIDPNLDNAISTPLMDYAKMTKSGCSGYEEMKKLSAVVKDNQIEFNAPEVDTISQMVMTELNKRLSTQDLINLPLYEAIHFSRMLPYKLQLKPESVPVFYSQMIILLNRFLNNFK